MLHLEKKCSTTDGLLVLADARRFHHITYHLGTTGFPPAVILAVVIEVNNLKNGVKKQLNSTEDKVWEDNLKTGALIRSEITYQNITQQMKID